MRTSRRTWLRRASIAAVVLVPLAFAGLFVGSIGQSDTAADRIPAAIVNQDELVYQTAADGTKTPVFAGRQLVTELTGADSKDADSKDAGSKAAGATGLDWTITNAKDAEAALKSGRVYAILTVPKDFSASIMSLQSQDPVKAELSIRTDDAHSYLTGAVAQSVGDGMVSTFGTAITEQYISGIYASVGQLGSAITQAADGAAGLSTGVSAYTSGVDRLSSGLSQLNGGAAKLDGVSSGVSQFTGGVAQLAQALAAANAQLQANPGDPTAVATVAAISAQLTAAAQGGTSLSQQTAAGIDGIQSGIAQSADGAAQLAAGSAQLSSGASSLADGLKAGAAQLPDADGASTAQAAKVASSPVGLTVTRDNEISGVGTAVATFFVPLGLWVGALAVFLVLRPVTRRALGSTATNGRLVTSALLRAAAVTGAQALLLVALLHLALGVSWAALPATLGFSLLMAFAFTAFHYLLTVGLGRAGLVVSLFVLAVQVTSTGGLYPVQMLAAPFQWISPLLPLTYGVQGMQGILAGGSAGPGIAAALVLLALGVLSVLLSLLVVRRSRRAQALMLAAPA